MYVRLLLTTSKVIRCKIRHWVEGMVPQHRRHTPHYQTEHEQRALPLYMLPAHWKFEMISYAVHA